MNVLLKFATEANFVFSLYVLRYYLRGFSEYSERILLFFLKVVSGGPKGGFDQGGVSDRADPPTPTPRKRLTDEPLGPLEL